MKTFLSCLFPMLCTGVFSQNVGINSNGSMPNSQAMLHVSVDDLAPNMKKGFLGPVMTTVERDASFPVPTEGLEIYNTTIHCMEFYSGSAWVSNCGGSTISGCPSGFVAVNAEYCIEVNQRQNLEISAANDTCGTKNAHLCSWAEWHHACSEVQLGNIVAQNMTNDWEWVDDALHENNFLVVGDGACGGMWTQHISTTSPSRCCFSR